MKNKNIENLTKNRIIILGILCVVFFMIITIRVVYMQTFDIKGSLSKLEDVSVKTIYSSPMPRGRILDRNNNIIVDNVGTYLISYKRENGTTVDDEIKLAYTLEENIDIDYSDLKTRQIREFWAVNNQEKYEKKLTQKERDLYKRRKIKSSELETLKLNRITEKELSVFDEKDKKAAYVYYLMNNGYYYDEKVIKDSATDAEYAFIAENTNSLKGVNISASWKRVYPYNETLRQILGNVSTSKAGIPNELKSFYLNKGYSLNDRVGLSYLEYQYEDDLKGTKSKYKIQNGKKTLIEEGTKGNDIVLSIDINLQNELEKIIEEELIKAKNEANTDYFDNTSVVITNPKTGEILAMAAKQIVRTMDDYKINDYTTSILTGSNTPGSVVKGASMLVGYSTGNLKIGDILYDKCIKFKNTPQKCSWKSLGTLNDITALAYSSNSYQFQLALKVAGVNYYHNMPIKIGDEALNKYRSVFNSLGLGVKSEIDLPNETKGYMGKKSDAGLLLNYAIGQYDMYTPLQLSSYVNTIANEGVRLKLNIVNEVRKSTDDNSFGKVIKKYERKELNKSDIDNIYFKRVKEGFESVMTIGIGRNYMGSVKSSAGKTGTSETFYDSNKDGIVDTATISKSFVGYAPASDPVMSIVAISPHVSHENSSSSYSSNVNKRIVSRICNIFFENYK